MKVYFLSKKSILNSLFICLLLCICLTVFGYYKDTAYSTFKNNINLPIYSVQTDKKVIAITFDCAWGGEDIPKICKILSEYNAKATFFVVGDWLERNNESAVIIHNNGQEIANHSENHLEMTNLSEEKIKEEIILTNKRIKELTGKDTYLFRAPYGAYNEKLITTAKSIGQYVIQWDVDSLDWKEFGTKNIIDRVNTRVNNGSIVLFHNDTKYILQALPEILSNLSSQGYKFIKVSDLILKENYYIDHKGRQHSNIVETYVIE